jgi:hypothetical protein
MAKFYINSQLVFRLTFSVCNISGFVDI